VARGGAMNHDALMAVFMLVTIPPLLVIMWCNKKRLQGIDWERSRKIKEVRIMVMLPHSVQLWRNLLESVRDDKPEEEQTKCAKEVYDYIKLMTK
jgi:hypothetical protein